MKAVALDGHLYLSSSEVPLQEGYEDVTTGLLRTWVDEGRLDTMTVGELAAAFGRTVPEGIDPHAAARVPGAGTPENVYQWDKVVAAETETRLTRRARGGRPRGRATRGILRPLVA